MGMEQGGSYIDEAGEYGGDSDFNIGMGAGGDEFAVDYAETYGGAQDYTGDYGSFGDTDLFGAYTDYYLESGFDLTTAMEMAAQDVAAGSIETVTSERGLLPDTPFPFYELPYVPDAFLTPYTPIFPEGPAPLPPIITPVIPFTVPAPPQTPLPQPNPYGAVPVAPGLPGPCPAGQYHPFVSGHPRQNECVPFPPAQVSKSPAPIPAGASGGGASKSSTQQQKPQQQQCPKGYYRDPATGQCKPIPQGQPQACPTGYFRASTGQCLPIPKCTTPGTVFDQATGLCVPKGQAISPLPEGVEGLFDELKNLPWWVWLALGGLILLSRDGEGGKKTTVTYRRAT